MTSDWVELVLNLKLTDSKTVSYKTTFLGIRSNDGKGFLIFFLLP